ncbi:MAG: hypothetical protein QME13_08870 [Thermoanaerobacteraceae bacterium]|nr:hypothetical protein [Thermoanaerobacteraceae bacterium]
MFLATEIAVERLVREGGRYLLRANNPWRDYPDIPVSPKDGIIEVVRRIVKRPRTPAETGQIKIVLLKESCGAGRRYPGCVPDQIEKGVEETPR